VTPEEKRAEFEPLAALDASIRRGLADAEAGRTKPAEEVFDRLENKYRDLVGH
jgi:antitoxin ParD1/3/4